MKYHYYNIMCPVCALTVAGGIVIAKQLGIVSLIIFILTVLVTVKIIKDKKKEPAKIKTDDFFGQINRSIKNILNCCGK